MLDRLKWWNIPDAAAKELATLQFSEKGQLDLDSLVFKAAEAKLTFYKNLCLCRLESTDKDDGFSVTSYVLSNAINRVISINGQSASVHTANDFEHLKLSQSSAEDYIRFFLFCVRGNGGSFNLVESLPDQSSPGVEVIAPYITPLQYLGMDEEERYRYKGIISFKNMLFSSIFAVSENGAIEMADDTILVEDISEAAIPDLPGLDGVSLMVKHMIGKMFKTDSAASESGNREDSALSVKSDKPALVTLVETLLERAMDSQAENRLISHFNAMQPGAGSGIDQFVKLVANNSPIIALETSLPFAEEIIADIVLKRVGRDFGVTILSKEQEHNSIKARKDNIVLITPTALQEIASLGQPSLVNRIPHDLSTKDVAAIIACNKFKQLPESLRAITDIVLKLPAMNADIFEEWFVRVMGSPAPEGWRQEGEIWCKYVLHTDFEHPRRMRLSPDKAIKYIREQVNERLTAVDPVQGMGLKDLHGLGEARQFAEDLIADIHAAIKGEIPWDQVDRGALLAGPPGTGKTTLAKAIAKDCNVKFIHASAAGWQAAGYLSEHVSAIRKTFADAQNYAPSILFIDEIDSLGNREQFVGHNAQYQTEVVNAVLEQIQGVDADAPVFVLGATNHEGRVDPALKRSGRMDRVIQIPRPNSEALGQIFGHYLGKLESGQADPAIDPAALGRLSVGMTGADVERIVRGAARRARRVGGAISQMDIIAEITNKPRNAGSSLRITPDELERTAYHEAGHAVAMCLSASQGADIGFVTIVPRDDGTLGFVKPNDDERVSYTRKDYEETIEVYLAGRVAEAIRYGEENVSSGATSDLKAATHLAISMVTKLGFGRSRKLLWTETPGEEDLKQAEQLISQMYDRIRDKLLGSKAALTNLAEELKARQELTGDEVRSIILQGKGKG